MYHNGFRPVGWTRRRLCDVTVVRGDQGYLADVYACSVASSFAHFSFLRFVDARLRDRVAQPGHDSRQDS